MKKVPLAKVYEALSAISSKRVIMNDTEAIVYSSDNKKQYKVQWLDNKYTSNDNATYWQGYSGYPVIAVLMLQKKISYNEEILSFFKDINWHDLNTKHKRNYEKAIKEFLELYSTEEQNLIVNSILKSYQELEKVDIQIVRKLD